MRSASKPPPHHHGSMGHSHSNSVSPFFPDLGATRARPSLAATMTRDGRTATAAAAEEAKESGGQRSLHSSSSKRGLGASLSTDSLHGGAPGQSQSQRALRSSASAATLPAFPTSHSPGAAVATEPLASLHPYSGPLLHKGMGAAPLPSNASAKLATKIDRWASVEELLEHSSAVIAAGGRMAPSGGSGNAGVQGASKAAAEGGPYDPASFSTFPGGEDSTLTTPKSTPLQRKALAASQRPSGSQRPKSPPVARSPFATQAPPPAPQPAPATWAGINPTPTPGLVRFQSDPSLRRGDGSGITELVRRVDARLRRLEREEKVVKVDPSVLFQAGMGPGPEGSADAPSDVDDFSATATTTTSTAMAAPVTKDGAGAGSKGAVERLWAQHQRMMAAARQTLPPSLRGGGGAATQRHVVSAVQGLHPRTLLRIFSPQLHVLSVSLAALEKMVRADDKQKAGLLAHLQAHQQLILDVLVQFAAVSCETMQGDVEEDDSADFAAADLPDDGGGSARLMAETLRIEADQGSSSLAALMFKPDERHATSFGTPPPATAAAAAATAAPLGQSRREAYESDGDDESFSAARETDLGRSFDAAATLSPSAAAAAAASSSSFDALSPSSLLPAASASVSFGNNHAWALERWRQRALALRAREIEDEFNFISCVDILAGLSTLRAREMEELASISPAAAASSSTSGASASSGSGGESAYAAVHGSYDTQRSALQERLDALKVRLDPTYAAKFIRFHQQILSIEEVERAAREEEELKQIQQRQQRRGAAGGVGGASGIGSSASSSTNTHASASSLALQMALLRRGEATHSTNASAYTSSREGGRAHRLPHSTWLSTSTPSSALLTLSLDEDGNNSNGSGSGNDAHTRVSTLSSSVATGASPSAAVGVSSSSLRSSRILSLVHLENVHTAAAEKQVELLSEHRSLLERHRALQASNRSFKKQAEETAAMHAAQLAELEAKLRAEISARLAMETDFDAIRYQSVGKDVKIEQLYGEIADLSYTVKQLQVTYTQHALYKPAVIDCAAGQTEEQATGMEQGGWDEHGVVQHQRHQRTGSFSVNAAVAAATATAAVGDADHPDLTEEESAVLIAAGLAHAHPAAQLAALNAAAASTALHGRDRLASAKRRPLGAAPSSAGSAAGGSPSSAAAATAAANHASAAAAAAAVPLQRRPTMSAGGSGAAVSGHSSGGSARSVTGVGAQSPSPSSSPSPVPTPTGLRRSAGSSRRTQSMSAMAASDAVALAEKARKAAANTERERHSQRELPALDEGMEH